MKILLPNLIICWLAAAPLSAAGSKPLYKLNQDELLTRLDGDAKAVRQYRQGLLEVIVYADSRPDLFPAKPPAPGTLLRRDQKTAIWNAWQRFLDYQLALGSIEKDYAAFYRLKGPGRETAWMVGYSAFAARYRAALDFVSRAERNPELDKILNDAVPELGLPAGTYGRLKLKYLNVAIATEFAAREVVDRTFAGQGASTLRQGLAQDTEAVWKAGRGSGEKLTAANALKVVRSAADSAWLPVQSGVAGWMGDTKVYRTKECLISAAQIKALIPKLEPGDILLERREWFLSNIGLPGFWSHAALYIGTAAERRAFFDEPETRAWVQSQGETGGNLERLLQMRYAPAWEQSQRPQEEGHTVRIVEAMSEGVSFTTLEHSAACDSLAVLRPRLPKSAKARAVLKAFHYSGRPYDFNFDFSTDSELVCTEVVYKAYEAEPGIAGMTFPLTEMLGRMVTPANDVARQFDADFGTPAQQSDLVVFLDGQERKKNAREASLEDFRQSWKRPKWHVLAQE